MKSNKFEILLFALASLAFLGFVPAIFFVLIPYEIITSEVQVYTSKIGAFRFIGTIPIIVGPSVFCLSILTVSVTAV